MQYLGINISTQQATRRALAAGVEADKFDLAEDSEYRLFLPLIYRCPAYRRYLATGLLGALSTIIKAMLGFAYLCNFQFCLLYRTYLYFAHLAPYASYVGRSRGWQIFLRWKKNLPFLLEANLRHCVLLIAGELYLHSNRLIYDSF